MVGKCETYVFIFGSYEPLSKENIYLIYRRRMFFNFEVGRIGKTNQHNYEFNTEEQVILFL